MRIQSHTTITITKKELLAGARYQDTLQSLTTDVAKVFGKDVPSLDISAVKKIKLALGGKEVIEAGPLKIELSKKGAVITVNFDENVNENIAVEYFDMVSDVVRIYVPALIGATTSIMAAQAAAQNRIDTGVKKITKAYKKG